MFIKSSKPAGEASAAPPGGADVLDADSRVVDSASSGGLGAFANLKVTPASDDAADTTKLGGLFSQKPSVAATPAPAKKAGLLGRFSKADKPAGAVPLAKVAKAEKPAKAEKAPKAEKPPKAAKPEKAAKVAKPARAKKPSAKNGEVFLLVELEDGKNLYWRVTAAGAEQVTREDATTFVSFSPKDFRFSTDLPLSNAAAQSLALSELGEEVRLVNVSKSQHAIFATPATRVADMSPVAIGPGLQVLEELLPMAAGVRENRIGGLQLHAPDGGIALVVLYHFTEQGEIGPPQVTVNPADLGFVLSQFVAARMLDHEVKVALVKNDDFLTASSSFKAYPNQSSFLGMPVSKVLNLAAVASMALAVGTCGYAAMGHLALQKAKSQLAAASAEKTRHLKSADELLKVSLASFSRTQAIDVAKVTDTARALWLPRSIIEVKADMNGSNYLMTMDLVGPKTNSGGLSALNRVEPGQVKALLELPAPEGCTKSVLNLSGGLDAAQISVECEGPLSGLRTYRLD